MENLFITDLRAGHYSFDEIETVYENMHPNYTKAGREVAFAILTTYLKEEMQLSIVQQGDDYLLIDIIPSDVKEEFCDTDPEPSAAMEAEEEGLITTLDEFNDERDAMGLDQRDDEEGPSNWEMNSEEGVASYQEYLDEMASLRKSEQ